MKTRRTNQVLVVSVALALAAATLAACGGSKPKVLSEADVNDAVVPLAALGSGWNESTSQDEGDDESLGCMKGTESTAEGRKAKAKAEGAYEVAGDMAVTSVSSAVASYATTDEIEGALDSVRDALKGCKKVKETDSEGTTISLEFTVDEEKSHEGADEQVNVVATGTSGNSFMELPVVLAMTFTRIGNQIVTITYVDLSNSLTPAYADLTTAAAQRVIDVQEGKKPSGKVIDGFAQGGEDAATGPGSSAEEQLPFDGGEYTWKSGVTMKTTVEKSEPWGTTDDFCGDGSCGVAEPGDTRFAMKYEITVPPDFEGSFEPISCPGQLHVESGNDEDAYIDVAGESAKYLDGTIRPGATKFGVVEYVIKKASASEEFYIESSCGDPDDSEIAFFGGTVTAG
ncbi:hypothetical protein ACFX43_09165 [Nocardioides sp. YIM B13467]|uniref:hypothetical protein n=1 Tax=Nocardioides sp. YIM B13467 TaxID=3366294 RepID=UPI00366DFF17